ncbi:MAG: hypothetical protein Q8P08_00775, partial [bacterium]|nr:hypothetical protein [bacterium]
MEYQKIIGWLVFVIGLLLIGWTLMTSYNIYTGKMLAPEFFEMPKEEILAEKGTDQGLEAQFEQMIGEQIKGLIPSDSFPQLLNLAVWSMLAFILIFGGTQISG